MYIKEFDKWLAKKKEVQNIEKKHKVRKGEVRWFSLGVNVGSEIDGKGESFTRPAVIIGQAGPELVLIAPCTSKLHSKEGYTISKFPPLTPHYMI